MKSGLRLLLLLIISAGISVATAMFWVQQPIKLPGDKIEFTIPPGTSMRSISGLISAAGVPIPPLLLNLTARLQQRAHRLKAGTYQVESGITPLTLLDKLERGDVLLLELTVPEGLNFAQMRALIDADTDLQHRTQGMDSTQLLKAIGASEAHPEGLFFPDTYRFSRGTTDLDIFKLAYLAQQKNLTAAWQSRAANLPYASTYEALTLASIVEKETGRPEDRARVAAVFVNRLRQGMPLQTDPTVIYGLGQKFDGNLRKNQLVTDGAYNTYTRVGLPPTPISMPGRASLIAALNPADTDDLYFVARGDGSSEFSNNLNDHNKAVNKFQKNH